MTDIQARLLACAEPVYRDFTLKLTPGMDPARVIGVRVPPLRAMAREYKGTEEAEAFLAALPHRYYEEDNLHAYLIALEPDFDRCLARVEAFLPYVDNWATCDTLTPKVFAKNRPALRSAALRWLHSDRTYTIRFGIKMLMDQFLGEDFFPEAMEQVAALRSEEYYVNMMVAWYFATALCKQPQAAMPYLQARRLSRWTHNKAIQKAVESFRITPEQKTTLRALRWS